MNQKELEEKCKQQEEEIASLRKKLEQIEKIASQVIWALANAVDAKDKYTSGHSVRVAEYSCKLARKMGKSKAEQKKIFYLALLHDIGKIGIPSSVLNKPGRLTDEEYEIIKSHPVIGEEILGTITEIPDITMGARWHHERYDGKGYPDGKKGEEIPEVDRIIAVADAYDAMSSARSYRGVLPQEVIREQLEKGRGTQFDPLIADKMLELMDEDVDYDMHE